jgi:hypothetical protein
MNHGKKRRKPMNDETPQLNLDDYRIPDPTAEDYLSRIENCLTCGRARVRPAGRVETTPYFCVVCERRYPASLRKATVDAFEYALKLRTGEIWYFTEARIEGDYVHLVFGDAYPHTAGYPPDCRFDRGVEVRVKDIIWCADAPDGG